MCGRAPWEPWSARVDAEARFWHWLGPGNTNKGSSEPVHRLGSTPPHPPRVHPPPTAPWYALPHARTAPHCGAPGAGWSARTRSLGRPKEILGVDNAHSRLSRTEGTLRLRAGPAARPAARLSLAPSAPTLRYSQYFSVFLSISQYSSAVSQYISVISQLYLSI